MKEEKLNNFEKSIETIGWFQIFLSPFIIGVILSTSSYFINPNLFTLIIGIIILIIAIVLGIKLASKIQKEQGTINFISNTSATPDLTENLKNKK